MRWKNGLGVIRGRRSETPAPRPPSPAQQGCSEPRCRACAVLLMVCTVSTLYVGALPEGPVLVRWSLGLFVRRTRSAEWLFPADQRIIWGPKQNYLGQFFWSTFLQQFQTLEDF